MRCEGPAPVGICESHPMFSRRLLVIERKEWNRSYTVLLFMLRPVHCFGNILVLVQTASHLQRY